MGDESPIFKKENSFNKENYRPASILPHMSKVFERILEIDTFITTKFSPYLCGFTKNHNTQNLLLKMIKNLRKHLDKGDKIEVMLIMGLLKAFDIINHSIPLVKLDAHVFSRTSLKLMQNSCN